MEGPAVELKEETNQLKFPQRTLFDIKIDPGLTDDYGVLLPRPFTKNQMRKWLKKVRWENNKAEKRRKEKARAKERRQEARAANIDLGPSRKSLKKWNLEKPKSNTGIIIDLSFDDLMSEKDRYKMIKQILRCYSINRRSVTPLQFYVTSFGDKTKLDISRHNGYENWDITFKECGYTDIFPKEKLFYLTSESDNLIESFAEDTFYIIGGLVDHNQHKGLCHKIAVEQGIRHGKLPLNKYVNMKTRKVLTIDHVELGARGITAKSLYNLLKDLGLSRTSIGSFPERISKAALVGSLQIWLGRERSVDSKVFEIVLRVSEGVSWQDALLQVLPMRKGAHVCDTASNASSVELSYDSDN